MTVLFIAFEFPPLAHGGVHRPLAFLKYLPEFGIRPIVLTTDENSYRDVLVNPPLDASLLRKVPGDAVIKRVPCLHAKPRPTTKFGEWRRIFFSLVEEGPKLWAPPVMACVEQIAQEHQVQAIYATAPPFHVANIGCQMARRLSLPLVLDLRDAWSQWRVGPYATWLHYFLTTRMERRCLMSATRVVTTSRQTRADLLRIHPQVPAEKIVVITNGYDREINDWGLLCRSQFDSIRFEQGQTEITENKASVASVNSCENRATDEWTGLEQKQTEITEKRASISSAAACQNSGTVLMTSKPGNAIRDHGDGAHPLTPTLSPSEGERESFRTGEEFVGAAPVVLAACARPFVIGYVGTFYYSPGARAAMMQAWWRKPPHRMLQYSPRKEDWLYRSPWFFFQAVAQLLADHPEYQARLRVRFAGPKPDSMDAQVEQFGLAGTVEFLGPLEHLAALKFQEECDALLVTSSKVIGGSDYSIAGKTFEYFSMRKPIIGFVAEGAQKDILAESGLAVICDPDNPAESARQLDELISGRIRLEPNAAFLKTLHRRELTGKLAVILRDAAESRNSQRKAETLKR